VSYMKRASSGDPAEDSSVTKKAGRQCCVEGCRTPGSVTDGSWTGWYCMVHGGPGMVTESGVPFTAIPPLPVRKCMKEGCTTQYPVYHTANKAWWTCVVHATKDMIHKKNGRTRAQIQARTYEGCRGPGPRCLIPTCLNYCKYFGTDHRMSACEAHVLPGMHYWVGDKKVMYVAALAKAPEPRVGDASEPADNDDGSEAGGPVKNIHVSSEDEDKAVETKLDNATDSKPTVSVREPIARGSKPIVSVREPTVSVREPTVSGREPTVSVRESAVNIRGPTVSVREPAASGLTISAVGPTVSVREPVASGLTVSAVGNSADIGATAEWWNNHGGSNETILIRAILRSRSDLTLETTNGPIKTHYDVVGVHLDLPVSVRGGKIQVSYPKEIVAPILQWCFKEEWLLLEDKSYSEVVQMLNFATKYPISKLHSALRARLVSDYKDFSHAEMLKSCDDVATRMFLCRKIADARIELTKAATATKCLNSPPQKCEGRPLYLCCKCDAGRLSVGVSCGEAFTCSHYTSVPTASMSSAAKLPIVTWCCEHGRSRPPATDRILEFIKALPKGLRDVVDDMMA
jgi:hypothetical protein